MIHGPSPINAMNASISIWERLLTSPRSTHVFISFCLCYFHVYFCSNLFFWSHALSFFERQILLSWHSYLSVFSHPVTLTASSPLIVVRLCNDSPEAKLCEHVTLRRTIFVELCSSLLSPWRRPSLEAPPPPPPPLRLTLPKSPYLRFLW